MSSHSYHTIPQAQRIQKRLVLNRSFKRIHTHASSIEKLTYMTLGGEDLYDVMDLLCVFDISELELRIVSYEEDPEVVKTAKRCRLVKTLKKLNNVTIQIMGCDFPSGIERYQRGTSKDRFVYFLDYMGTFSEGERQSVGHLMAGSMLRAGDYLLVTSSLNPFFVNKTTFMHRHLASFSVFFNIEQPSVDFKVRNHVDLHLGMAASDFERQRAWSSTPPVHFELLGKFRYNDTGTPMGVWVYAVTSAERRLTRLDDVKFEAFPHAFSYTGGSASLGLFDDLFDS